MGRLGQKPHHTHPTALRCRDRSSHPRRLPACRARRFCTKMPNRIRYPSAVRFTGTVRMLQVPVRIVHREKARHRRPLVPGLPPQTAPATDRKACTYLGVLGHLQPAPEVTTPDQRLVIPPIYSPCRHDQLTIFRCHVANTRGVRQAVGARHALVRVVLTETHLPHDPYRTAKSEPLPGQCMPTARFLVPYCHRLLLHRAHLHPFGEICRRATFWTPRGSGPFTPFSSKITAGPLLMTHAGFGSGPCFLRTC